MANTNQQIRKQVNFYLSDSNLPYDKFLWTLREKTPEGCKYIWKAPRGSKYIKKKYPSI
jgi:hypothetical protein